MNTEQQVRKAIKLDAVDFRRVKALDKQEYKRYLFDKQVALAINQPPEIAVQIVRELLLLPDGMDILIKHSPAFGRFAMKFKDFILSDKYDKIEALSDYALGKYEPKVKGRKRWYSKGKYYKV